MTRPSVHEWGLGIAEVTALRATCLRRSVGCVLLDRGGLVLATGYNGVARGMAHCNEEIVETVVVLRPPNDRPTSIATSMHPHACKGASCPSGTGLDLCEAIHAEQNAIIQCPRPADVWTCCVTVSPCVHCVKMLMNTGCQEIVFREEYVQGEARGLWLLRAANTGRRWIHLPK